MRKFKVATHNSDWSGEEVQELTAREFIESYTYGSKPYNTALLHIGTLLLTIDDSDTIALVYHDQIAAKRYTICSMID
jgi:hypothetical protein